MSTHLNPWDQFLESSRPEIGYEQSSWWADFLATRGWRSFTVVVRESDTIVGGAKVLVSSFAPGQCFYYVPDGPVLPLNEADAEQVFEALLAYINQERKHDLQRVSHLRLEPRWCQRPSYVRGFREAGTWLAPRRTLCVDLDLSEIAILEQMKPKGRYNVRLARRKGVSIVEDRSPRGVSDFLEIYHETFRRHGIRGHSNEYFGGLMKCLDAGDRGSLFFAEFHGERLATALVLFYGDRATYKYGGSLAAFRRVMAPYLLHFEIILRAKSLGLKWYDFHGIGPSDEPNDRWANFSIFKRKFGGVERCFVPALDLIYDASAYEDYRRQ